MNTQSVLNRPTLVLNRNWTPIQTTTIRQAIGLVVSGSAKIIDPLTYEVHDIDSWDAVSKARSSIAGPAIRSMHLSLAPPEVVVLTRYTGIGRQSVVFSRRNLFKRDHYACQYCGSQPGTKEMTIDHILPKSRGGKSTWNNCVLACIKCNGKKSNRTPREAGMTLRKSPKKPRWSAIYRTPAGQRCESWKHFVSQAYWEVKLEP